MCAQYTIYLADVRNIWEPFQMTQKHNIYWRMLWDLIFSILTEKLWPIENMCQWYNNSEIHAILLFTFSPSHSQQSRWTLPFPYCEGAKTTVAIDFVKSNFKTNLRIHSTSGFGIVFVFTPLVMIIDCPQYFGKLTPRRHELNPHLNMTHRHYTVSFAYNSW